MKNIAVGRMILKESRNSRGAFHNRLFNSGSSPRGLCVGGFFVVAWAARWTPVSHAHDVLQLTR